MRGFGATASNNTLILINGRRINDLDLAGVDLSSIPRESIDHIEITRGNSGAVLYGDGAVGGVINIVLKNGASLPPSGRVTAAIGSFKYGEGGAAMNTSSGPWAMSAYANVIGSDGYRQNNVLRQQVGVTDFRYTGDTGGGYLTLSADDQSARLSGRPAGDADLQRARHLPDGGGDAVRLRQEERHQRHRRHHAHARSRQRTDRRRRHPGEAPDRPGSSTPSARTSIPTSTPT